MADDGYIHGYHQEEQHRLIKQAARWHDLILWNIEYNAGESLLEVGCGVGAALGILASAFPGLKLSGIDIQEKQVRFAREYLSSIGHTDVDLRVGDANNLPWHDETFDHVYIMWVLEHVKDHEDILSEAKRVLRAGGSLTVTETDYTTIQLYPDSEDFEYLRTTFCDLFNLNGNAIAGRMLGTSLELAGFGNVKNNIYPMHFFNQRNSGELAEYITYLTEFMRPVVYQRAATIGRDQNRLKKGLAFFESVADHPQGAITHLVYRATARK